MRPIAKGVIIIRMCEIPDASYCKGLRNMRIFKILMQRIAKGPIIIRICEIPDASYCERLSNYKDMRGS